MAEFETVAKIGEIPDSEGRCYLVNGKMVAVFHSDSEYSAISDTCPHMGISLAGGHVEDGQVTCPWHAWRFSVKDGSWLDHPGSKLKVDSYEVRVVGDEIQVCVPDDNEPATESEKDEDSA